MKTEIPTPDFLAGISDEGVKSFEREVLEGPLFRGIIQRIEDNALAGYTGYSRQVFTTDEMRSLTVIRKNLQTAGYYCEFEIKTKRGIFGEYKEQRFVIDWSGEKNLKNREK